MLEDHEARIATLEAAQTDYRAVLAAVNALGANQRDNSTRLTSVDTRLTGVETRLTRVETGLADFHEETRAQFRSVEEHFSEMRDLIIDLRDGPRRR